MKLNKVGVLLREGGQSYPPGELRDLFARHGMELATLHWEQEPPADLDLVMAMGGDGTALKALELCTQSPVLAINFGTVGFLTAADGDDLERVLSLLVSGDYLISERLVLDCQHPHGRTRVINEVILRAGSGFLYTDVAIDGTKIRTIKGDGVVVGTPTGSTGFLLSAGAPIVMPDVRCLILDGINEHNFTSRSLILPPESKVRLQISAETRDPELSVIIDGRRVGPLRPGDGIDIEQSPANARLIYFEDSYFFRNLTTKLSW